MSSTALAAGVCKIGDTEYPTLQAAVDTITDGTQTTITLLGNKTGGGVKVKSGQNIIFELDGHTYTVNEKTVGSSGTETNGFQLLKGSNVTFQNGTIYAGGSARILLQNYANLTLKDVTGCAGKRPVRIRFQQQLRDGKHHRQHQHLCCGRTGGL